MDSFEITVSGCTPQSDHVLVCRRGQKIEYSPVMESWKIRNEISLKAKT